MTGTSTLGEAIASSGRWPLSTVAVRRSGSARSTTPTSTDGLTAACSWTLPEMRSAIEWAVALRASSLSRALPPSLSNSTARPAQVYPPRGENVWVSWRIRKPRNGFSYPSTPAATIMPARSEGHRAP